MAKSQQHILITGGTGGIGRVLTQQLLGKGYAVSHLSREKGNGPHVKTFLWDVHKNEIDETCIDDVDIIIHLAGAGIAEKRWTEARKREIIDSRTKSIELLYFLLSKKEHKVNSVISASAIGYYSNRGDELMTEESPPNSDFMARCCVEWEDAVDEGEKLGLRIVKFRTGVVLDAKGKSGALGKMAKPIKWGVGAPLGNGKQWIPWVHEQDVAAMYMYAVKNPDFSGVYNMVAPNPVTNKHFTKAIAKQLHRPIWLPNVPAWLLKLALGEMSTIVLGSTKVSAQKIKNAGFQFKYTDIETALRDIYG